LRGVSKDGRKRLWPSFEARREERRAPLDDGGIFGPNAGEMDQRKAATEVAAFLAFLKSKSYPPLPPITARTVSSGPTSSAPST
jgi:hypothetical protein